MHNLIMDNPSKISDTIATDDYLYDFECIFPSKSHELPDSGLFQNNTGQTTSFSS